MTKGVKIKTFEKYCLLCLYFVACTHYIDGLVSVALYIILPSAFIICFARGNSLKSNWVLKSLCLLYAWIVFCSFFSPDMLRTATHLKQIFGCFISSFVVASLAKDTKRIFWLYLVYVLFLVATWQYALGRLYGVMDLSSSQLNDESNKLNANTFAYFTFYATFIIYIMGDMNIKWAKFMKILFPLTLVLSFATAIFSSSRQVLVIQLPFILLLLLNRYNLKSTRNRLVFLAIIVAAIVGYIYIGESVFDNSYLAHRAEANVREDTRLLILKECIQIGLDNLIVGAGPGCVSMYISTGNFSHNTYLELFAGTGLVGGLIFVIMLFKYMIIQFKRWKKTEDPVFMSFFIFGIVWAVDQFFYVFHSGLWLISFFVLVATHSDVYMKERYFRSR